MNRLRRLVPTYARIPIRPRRLRPLSIPVPVQRTISTSHTPWSRPHLVFPATPTKDQSYATQLLPLPDPPVQPAAKALLVLYVPYESTKWPSHLEIEDDLVDRLGKVVALNGVRLVVAYDGGSTEGIEQVYRAKLLVPGGLVESFPSITQSTLTTSDFLGTLASVSTKPTSQTPYTEILVCTHGARDCRCSDIGGDLVLALRAEVERRGEVLLPSGEEAEREENTSGVPRWKITECAHVGGHKWAANAISIPSLTFLSNLRPSHAPLLIDHLVNPEDAELKRQLWKEHFRGVIGQRVEEQVTSWETGIANPAAETESMVDTDSSPAPPPERTPLVVRFTTHDGATHDVRGYEGESLMEIAKREGLGAVEGTCGGHCECATCHMYIPYKLIDPPYTGLVPDLTDAEEDMLDYALGVREEESRLGCRIAVNEGLSEWSLGGKGVELPQY
ncbi:hypothetical protein QFC21_004413 [Naganishia friedmannii]|uniref:Uncharacterized protein n=1 Tax=Naganishia friedmannii TaxID=89922 RepID=A0ACC2VI51_9TREE|nr:hypothetical protein QFC21_004413 [Naganishia friedmannii]